MSKSITFIAMSFLFLHGGGNLQSGEETPLDVYGDPLPRGATARFGSLRWRIRNAIEAVAVSPNGKLVVAVNMYGKVAVWEMETGRLLHEISGSGAGAASVAFSPDGKYLATGGRPDYKTRDGDFRIRIWDLQNGKLKTLFPSLDSSPISKLVFTSDSSMLISAGFGQPVTVWKSPSGEKIREFPTDDGAYHNVALSPDEQWLAVSGDDLKTVTIYSFDGSRKLCTLKSKWNYFDSFEFAPDSKSLLTHEHDRLRYWDITTGEPRSTIPLKHDTNRQAYLAPDGKKIAMIGLGHEIEWLDVATGKPLDSWKGYKSDSYTVGVLAFSRDGKSLVTGDWGVVRVWDASKGKVIQQRGGPDKISYTLDFSANGKTLLAASVNCLYFLDGQTLRERARVPVALDRFYSAAISPDGNLAAFLTGKEEEISLVDSREPQRLRTLPSPGWFPASLAFSPDGKHLYATGDKSAGLRVWNVETGQEIAPLDKNIETLSNLSVAHRAAKLAVAVKGAKPYCRLRDLRTGKEELGLLLENDLVEHGPDKILLSDDGKLLLAYYVNSHISVWDISNKVERHRFKYSFEDGPFRWAFSSDGKLLVTSHAGGTLKTWDMADGKKVAEVCGHPSDIVALACSPDGALVSTCTSCTVLRWQRSAWQGK